MSNYSFLHGDLNEEVYMALCHGPPTSNSSPPQVCKIYKLVYGLKQASKKWYSKLSLILLYLGYTQSHADHSLYIKSDALNFTDLLVYVDEKLVVGNSMTKIQHVKLFLDKQLFT